MSQSSINNNTARRLAYSTEQEKTLIKDLKETNRKNRILEVRMQEDLISREKVKIYNETIAKQRELDEKNIQYKEFIIKKQRIEKLINEKKLLQEKIGKAERDAEEAIIRAEKAKQQKLIQDQDNRQNAIARGNQALKEKKYNDFQKKIKFEEIHCIDRKMEIKKLEDYISRDNAKNYKLNEIKTVEEEEVRKTKNDQIYKSQPDYVVTCFHNTKIIKHNPSAKSAIERAKEESERLIHRINEEIKIKKTNENQAEMRGQNAENKSQIDSELQLLEKELEELNYADNLIKIQEGKTLPSQGIKPITLERKRQKNEDAFENELKEKTQNQKEVNTKINFIKKLNENLSPNINLANPPKLIIKMPGINQQSPSKKAISPLKSNYNDYYENKIEETSQNSKNIIASQKIALNEAEDSSLKNDSKNRSPIEEDKITTQKETRNIIRNSDPKDDSENYKEVYHDEVKNSEMSSSPEEENKEIAEIATNKPSYIHVPEGENTKKSDIKNLRYEIKELDKLQNDFKVDEQTPYFDKNEILSKNKNKNPFGSNGGNLTEKLPSHIFSPISDDQQKIDIKTLQFEINKVTNELNDLQHDRDIKYNDTFGANDKLDHILNSYGNKDEPEIKNKEEQQNLNQIRDKTSFKYMEEFLKIGQDSSEKQNKNLNKEDENSVLSSVLSSGKKSPFDKIKNEKSAEKYNSHAMSNFSHKKSNSPNSELNYSQTDHSPSPYKLSESKLKNDQVIGNKSDLNYRVNKGPTPKKGIVIEIKNEEGFKSLGEDLLLNKKKMLEERLSKGNQFQKIQTVKDHKTKEEILKYRKEIMKPKNRTAESKPITQENNSEANNILNERVSKLMNRLAKGEKPQVI